MRTRETLRTVGGGLLLSLGAAIASAQPPAGTAFTYQGRLTDGGSPASGAYDLQLALFDAAAGGTQVGPSVVKDDVAVTAGLFTVSVDFGPKLFIGFARFLQIGVRPGAGTGGFTLIGPRQELQPAPHAVYAATAPWAGLTLVPSGFADGIDDDSGGDVTGVTAGAGLTGGGAAGGVTLAVDFTGSSGSANAAARTDHHHLSQTWTGAGGVGLTVQNTGTALSAETSGATSALIGNVTATSGLLTNGVWGRSASTGGRGVYGQSFASTGTPYGVYGSASAPDGTGVYGTHLATTGVEAGVTGETGSVSNSAAAVLGRVTSAAPGGNSAGVRGINNGTGPLGIGVWGSHAGSGWGVNGTTVSGIGVRGSASTSSGIGVVAIGGGTSGTALSIANGALRVQGAGEGTTTPVFVHVATTANSCGSPLKFTVIDHPLANGDPDAIVLVTPRNVVGARVFYSSLMCGFTDRWVIDTDGFSLGLGPAKFNVLVVKP